MSSRYMTNVGSFLSTVNSHASYASQNKEIAKQDIESLSKQVVGILQARGSVALPAITEELAVSNEEIQKITKNLQNYGMVEVRSESSSAEDEISLSDFAKRVLRYVSLK